MSDAQKNQRDLESIVEQLLKEFRAELKEHRFYGHYFDRKSDLPERICDESGQFLCEGRFDADFCYYNSNAGCEKSDEIKRLLHTINPYESPESRYEMVCQITVGVRKPDVQNPDGILPIGCVLGSHWDH